MSIEQGLQSDLRNLVVPKYDEAETALRAELEGPAALYFSGIAQDLLDTDVEARFDAQAARWAAWDEQVVEPLFQAAPQSLRPYRGGYENPVDEVSFKTTVPITDRGFTTEAPLELDFRLGGAGVLHLIEATDGVDYISELTHLVDMGTLTPKQLRQSSPEIMAIARRANVYIPFEDMQRTFLGKIVLRPTVDLDQLLERVESTRRAEAAAVRPHVYSIEFTVMGDQYPRCEAAVHGKIYDPTMRNVETPYAGLFKSAADYSPKEYMIKTTVRRLRTTELEEAAEQIMPQEQVEKILVERFQPLAEDQARKEAVADELLEAIVVSEAFKKAIAA